MQRLAARDDALVLIYGKFKDSYKPALDAFGGTDAVPSQFGIVWLVAPSAVLACIVHPNLNQVWWSDVAWTFALYTEAVAVIPQLYMFTKGDGSSGTKKKVESFVSHYVFSLGFSRLLNLVSVCGAHAPIATPATRLPRDHLYLTSSMLTATFLCCHA